MADRPARWLLIRSAISVVSATSMLLSPSDTTAASSWLDPVGPVIDGGRVELAAYGFAITFPEDWTVRQVTPEGERAFWGEGSPDGQSLILAAERTLQDDYCFVEFDDPSARDEPVSLAHYAAWVEDQWLEDPAYDDEARTRVDLPVGPAWRIDSFYNTRSESWYVARGADGIYKVECASSDPSADRWLSIAETLEFLPDPASGSIAPSPVLGGGRIARPAEGFAVTFPEEWTVEEVTPEFDEWWWNRTPEQRVLAPTILWADQPGSDGYCLVVDFTRLAEKPPAWRSVRAATRGLWFDWRDDETLVGPEYVLQGFPLGRMGHLSAISVDGWTQDGYVYSDSALWMYLACWSPDAPEDRWLSIAETFEFLPAEE